MIFIFFKLIPYPALAGLSAHHALDGSHTLIYQELVAKLAF